MRELGDHAASLHTDVGKAVAENGIDRLFVLGEHAFDLAEGALMSGMNYRNITILPEDYCEAAKIIASQLENGDAVLFKASRALHFETLLEECKNRL